LKKNSRNWSKESIGKKLPRLKKRNSSNEEDTPVIEVRNRLEKNSRGCKKNSSNRSKESVQKETPVIAIEVENRTKNSLRIVYKQFTLYPRANEAEFIFRNYSGITACILVLNLNSGKGIAIKEYFSTGFSEQAKFSKTNQFRTGKTRIQNFFQKQLFSINAYSRNRPPD